MKRQSRLNFAQTHRFGNALSYALSFTAFMLFSIIVNGRTVLTESTDNEALPLVTKQRHVVFYNFQTKIKTLQKELLQDRRSNITSYKCHIVNHRNLYYLCSSLLSLEFKRLLLSKLVTFMHFHRKKYNECICIINLNMTEKNKNLKYLFLDAFTFMSLFCSSFSQGNFNLPMKNPKRNILLQSKLFGCSCICDKCVDLRSILRLSHLKHICSNIKCNKSGEHKTISSITDNLSLKMDQNSEQMLHRSDKNLSASNKVGTFHIQRRLLSEPKIEDVNETSKTPPRDTGDPREGKEEVREKTYTSEPFNYTEFQEVVEYLKRKGSKDSFWAMFSIMLLMCILVWAIWCCGMRKIHTEKYINVTIDEHFHYVSIRDILKSKKKYLSKKILQFKRRHMHRKHKYKQLKVPVKQVEDVTSDNSEEERLIYANDF